MRAETGTNCRIVFCTKYCVSVTVVYSSFKVVQQSGYKSTMCQEVVVPVFSCRWLLVQRHFQLAGSDRFWSSSRARILMQRN